MTKTNEIIEYYRLVRPQLWDAPEHERVAFVLHHCLTHKTDWDVATDALAELVPEQREFWLRVQATWNYHFVAAMTAAFREFP